VGGNREVRSDVRIIAATNRNLAQMVADGGFREDLFHRLNVIPISLPPLRERKEDVPLLAGHFLARYSKRMGKNVTGIDEAVVRSLIEFEWPGNVRELENTIERAVALCAGERITSADVTLRDMGEMAFRSTPGNSGSQRAVSTARMAPVFSVTETQRVEPHSTVPISAPPAGAPILPEAGIDLERHLLETERAYIIQALERTDWNLTEAAKILGMTFRSIRYRVSKLGIERPPK
jgi:two-component system response regulator PilR (NtrC family)